METIMWTPVVSQVQSQFSLIQSVKLEHIDSIRSSDTINDFESLSSIDAQFMMGEKYPKNETFDIGNDIESLSMSHTV